MSKNPFWSDHKLSKVSCCKDCTKRQIGCHSTCSDYIKQHAERQKLNKLMYNEKRKHYDVNSYKLNVIAKSDKRKSKTRVSYTEF